MSETLPETIAKLRKEAGMAIAGARAIIDQQEHIISLALERIATLASVEKAALAGVTAEQAPETKPRAVRGQIEKDILAALERMAAAPCDAADIAEATGHKPSSVRACLKRLYLLGTVVRDGDFYSLPAKGAEAAG